MKKKIRKETIEEKPQYDPLKSTTENMKVAYEQGLKDAIDKIRVILNEVLDWDYEDKMEIIYRIEKDDGLSPKGL